MRGVKAKMARRLVSNGRKLPERTYYITPKGVIRADPNRRFYQLTKRLLRATHGVNPFRRDLPWHP